MKSKFLYILALCAGLPLFGQQELGLNLMPNTPQAQLTNPAMYPDRKGWVYVFSPYLNYSYQGFKMKNLIKPVANSDSSELDLDGAFAAMKEMNYVRANFNTDLLGFGFKIKEDIQIGVNYGFRSNFMLGYPKNLLKLAWQGNGPYVGQTVNVAPDFSFNNYSELGISGAYRLMDDRLTVGGRIKFLNGIADISVDKKQREFSLYTDPEYYQLTATSDYLIHSSQVFTGDSAAGLSFINPGDWDFFNRNRGMGFDLGGTFKLNDKWSFAASVVDIGSIKWSNNVRSYHSKGQYTYEGISFNALAEGDSLQFQNILDTLGQRFKFESLQSDPYRTSLPTKVYLNAGFRPVSFVQVGGLVYGEFYRGTFNPAFAVTGDIFAKKWLQFGTTIAYRNARANWGLRAVLNLGPTQFFVASDNVSGLFNPLSNRNGNIRFGTALRFGQEDND